MRAFAGRLALGVTCAAALVAMRPVGATGALPTPIADVDADTGVPSWLFPSSPPPAAPPRPFDSVVAVHLPRVGRTFVDAQLHNLFFAPDWDSAAHPVMPEVVARGRTPSVFACAYCHMPDGAGRPENVPLAGLPAAYITQQVADMKSHARSMAWRGGAWAPSTNMVITAEHATEEEVAVAAAYFSSLRPRQRTHVVEAAEIPRVLPATGLFVRAPGNEMELLNGRLIEVPADVARHDYRDPYLEYDAYVPVGSVARGRRLLATPMNEARQVCGSCHGPALRGMGVIPPLAGRSPAYLVRQLLAFKTGTRDTPAGAPMRLVSQKLSLRDMISVAAYTATLQP